MPMMSPNAIEQNATQEKALSPDIVANYQKEMAPPENGGDHFLPEMMTELGLENSTKVASWSDASGNQIVLFQGADSSHSLVSVSATYYSKLAHLSEQEITQAQQSALDFAKRNITRLTLVYPDKPYANFPSTKKSVSALDVSPATKDNDMGTSGFVAGILFEVPKDVDIDILKQNLDDMH